MSEPWDVEIRHASGDELPAAFRTVHRAADVAGDLPVLLIGDAAHGEFRTAIATLDSCCRLTIARSVAAALAELEGAASPPSLIVVAQARPGEYSEVEIDALRRSAPLAPFVALLGSWCEGETRSGRPWPGVVRVYWRQWRGRAWPELAALRAGRTLTWGLPATASEEERLLSAALEPIDKQQGLIAVAAENFAMADWLADACRVQGFATVRTSAARPVKASGVAAVLWDAGLAAEASLAELAALRDAFTGTPVTALVDFPRIEHHEGLLAAGAAGVLSKPVMLAELAIQFQEATATAQSAERRTRSKDTAPDRE